MSDIKLTGHHSMTHKTMLWVEKKVMEEKISHLSAVILGYFRSWMTGHGGP
jgi:hypothetical protein